MGGRADGPGEVTFCRQFLVSKIDYGTFRGLFERSEFRRNVPFLIDEANLEPDVPLQDGAVRPPPPPSIKVKPGEIVSGFGKQKS